MTASTIAYLGPAGTFTHQATLLLSGVNTTDYYPASGVVDAINLVRLGDVPAALVPLENSIEGAVGPTLDELAFGEHVVIVGEVVMSVEFVLATKGARRLSDITTVTSHPHALAQCANWTQSNLPCATATAASSTAGAAQSVARGTYDAAICAPIAAQNYGLTILETGIADNADAQTRFVLLSKPVRPPNRTGNDVTSLVAFISADRIGALMEVLTEFAIRGINLTRIESRPTKQQLGRYCFFLDCVGHVDDACIGEALTGLKRRCHDVRYLGSYPKFGETEPRLKALPGQADSDYTHAAAWLERIRSGTSMA